MNPNKASAGKYPQSSVVDDQYQTPESQPSFKPKSSNYTSIRPSPRSPSSVNSEAAQAHPRPYLKKIANSNKGGFPSPGTPESAFETGSVPEPIGSSIEHEVADAFRAQVFAACVASSKLHRPLRFRAAMAAALRRAVRLESNRIPRHPPQSLPSSPL